MQRHRNGSQRAAKTTAADAATPPRRCSQRQTWNPASSSKARDSAAPTRRPAARRRALLIADASSGKPAVWANLKPMRRASSPTPAASRVTNTGSIGVDA
jgi:hypothetical protein